MVNSDDGAGGRALGDGEPGASERTLSAPAETLHLEDIERHVEHHIGPIHSVLHEIVSDLIHLDVLVVAPTPQRNCWTFVTSGMSDRAMTVPDAVDDPSLYSHAELTISLPANWITDAAGRDGEAIEAGFQLFNEHNYYPVGWLKRLARFPHDYATWFALGHTIPNGDPAQPIGTDTNLIGFVLAPPITLDPGFFALDAASGARINFYTLVALHADEMAFKLKHDADALFERLRAGRVDDIYDPGRGSVLAKRGWFGWRN